MFKVLPNDPKISEMDPVQRLWMYNNWIADQTDKSELAKQHAYLLGSFWNPEAVKKMLGEGVATHASTEEEFEESWKMVEESKRPTTGKRRRRRKG